MQLQVLWVRSSHAISLVRSICSSEINRSSLKTWGSPSDNQIICVFEFVVALSLGIEQTSFKKLFKHV